MSKKGKSLTEEYPSLELAYEQVKGVLNQQQETAHSLDSKASVFIAVATAILGVGLSLGISRVMNAQLNIGVYGILLIITLAPIYFYYTIWGLAVKALRLRAFKTLSHPLKIRKEFWHLQQEDFMYDILLHTEKAFRENDKKLKKKAKDVDKLLQQTVWETFVVIVWMTAVALITSYLN